jgi:hypothetical protein
MGLDGWGWQDNGYGTLGPLLYFATTGPQTVRVQQREDGMSVDQIVLSPLAFLQIAPGASKADRTMYPASPSTLSSPEVVLYASTAAIVEGAWRRADDETAASRVRLWNPDAERPKLTAAAAAPTTFFELAFQAEAGRAYRLWIRGKADGDSWTNDSVFVQFSGSVTETGTPVFRIGTTEGTVVSIEEGSGKGLAGWGWQDNGYDRLGPLVYFAVSGPQTIRIQQREDGVSIDQIVLSASKYLTAAPGASKNDGTVLPAQ